MRVSYPASLPAVVALQLVASAASESTTKGGAPLLARGTRSGARKLLDTEKVFVRGPWPAATAKAGDQELEEVVVELRAKAAGWPAYPSAAPRRLVYDIVAERLYLGLPSGEESVRISRLEEPEEREDVKGSEKCPGSATFMSPAHPDVPPLNFPLSIHVPSPFSAAAEVWVLAAVLLLVVVPLMAGISPVLRVADRWSAVAREARTSTRTLINDIDHDMALPMASLSPRPGPRRGIPAWKQLDDVPDTAAELAAVSDTCAGATKLD